MDVSVYKDEWSHLTNTAGYIRFNNFVFYFIIALLQMTFANFLASKTMSYENDLGQEPTDGPTDGPIDGLTGGRT